MRKKLYSLLSASLFGPVAALACCGNDTNYTNHRSVCFEALKSFGDNSSTAINDEFSDELREVTFSMPSSIDACKAVMRHQSSECQNAFSYFLEHVNRSELSNKDKYDSAIVSVDQHCTADSDNLLMDSIVLFIATYQQKGQTREIISAQRKSLREVRALKDRAWSKK